MKIDLSLSKAISIPLLILNILFLVVMSVYLYVSFDKMNNENFNKLYTENLSLFSSLVSQDIIMGQYASVEKKCNQFFDQNTVSYIQILTEENLVVCRNGSELSGGNLIKKNLYFDTKKEERAAEVVLGYKKEESILSRVLMLLLFLTICFFTVAIILNNYLKKVVIRPLEKMTRSLSEIVRYTEVKEDDFYNNRVINITELNSLFKNRNELLKQLQSYQDEIVRNVEDKVIVEVAQQVAHDIRSPLAALDMAINNLDEIEKPRLNLIKTALNRIRSIADNMQQKTRASLDITVSEGEEFNFFTLLSEAIEEKRLEYIEKSGLEINFNYCEKSTKEWGCFSQVDLKRVLSNLINNSVEALPLNRGVIEVKFDSDSQYIYICISDNGVGIDSTDLDKVLEKNFTKGKKSGTGLGLSHAKEKILNWGGSIFVSSIKGEGTEISISLPKMQVQEVLIDDDELIRFTWAEAAKNKERKFLCFESCEDFEAQLPELEGYVVLYLDSHLSNDCRGEEKAKEYYEKGIKEIYLETGNESSSYNSMYWIKEIIGKNPPW
ncbi:HAMP domain-containing sensor histidine kinase [Halobacteriovorax sp. JY17]|uniref:sensor histidine kinase n=1 Tax=Halobacteriovorax sp. JY17 TaxID=2014617 RepID=UPI000C35E952|nr:HAMP domain-containing sensor histidine kinase [Halobacteriovorax sp. JY17]PIK14060.1 MAG: hypothetical protein CES88_13840 [Halobacteriovorax sp. JY17]